MNRATQSPLMFAPACPSNEGDSFSQLSTRDKAVQCPDAPDVSQFSEDTIRYAEAGVSTPSRPSGLATAKLQLLRRCPANEVAAIFSSSEGDVTLCGSDFTCLEITQRFYGTNLCALYLRPDVLQTPLRRFSKIWFPHGTTKYHHVAFWTLNMDEDDAYILIVGVNPQGYVMPLDHPTHSPFILVVPRRQNAVFYPPCLSQKALEETAVDEHLYQVIRKDARRGRMRRWVRRVNGQLSWLFSG